MNRLYHLCPFWHSLAALVLMLILTLTKSDIQEEKPPLVTELPSIAKETSANKSELQCLDFLGMLIDHMVRRITVHLAEPTLLAPISNSIFTLNNGRLYGLKSIRRTCPIGLSHEELRLKSTNSTANQDVQLSEWIQKRDNKLSDLLHINFCLGIPRSLQLRGSMAVSMFWTTYDPEDVRITLSDISIKVKLRLQLNMTGEMRLELEGMHVNKLGTIQFEQELTETGQDGEQTSGGFLAQYASWADWLANGPLYTPLVIVLETLLNDSFRAMLKEKQANL